MKLPREHGFWVMMPAALLSGMDRANFALDAVLAGVTAGIVTAIVGGIVGRRLRSTDWAQLLASFALALLVLPAELVAGLELPVVATHAAAWASLFLGCSFSVRACFARASKQRRYAPGLQLAAVALPIAMALALIRWGDTSTFAVALVGAVGVLGIALWRPTPKQLKKTGIVMAIVVLAALGSQIFSARYL